MEQPIEATVLGPESVLFPVSFVEVSEGLMKLGAASPVALLALVKVVQGDSMWLGQVRECRAEGNAWVLSISIEHELRGLQALRQMAERFSGQRNPRVLTGA